MGRKSINWKTLSTTILFSAGFHLVALLACTFIVMSNPQLLEEIFTEVTENKEITDEPIVEQAVTGGVVLWEGIEGLEKSHFAHSYRDVS